MLGRAANALATLPVTQSFDDVADYVRKHKAIDLKTLSGEQRIDQWQGHEAFVMVDVARREVLSGLRAGHALDQLREFIADYVWDEDAGAISRLLSSGGAPDASITADTMLYAVGKGEAALDDWLAIHSHRGVGEFDLASPRWRETPEAAREAARRLASGESPTERHHRHANAVQRKAEAIRATLSAVDAKEFDRRVSLASQAVSGREAAKDQLMLGYDLLRDIGLHAGRRLGIGDDVFYLSREQLFAALRSGETAATEIQQAKAIHAAEARLQPPRFIDADVAVRFGERQAIDTQSTAMAISGGVATGPALVVHSPDEVGQVPRGYVLVCPSTDPSWTPAFTGASALVIECGGALSHGAVVAREMGLPSVVLADATRRFKTGDVLRVDGDSGHAALADDPSAIDPLPTKNDVHIPQLLLPPPAGRKDRTAARWRNRAAAVWTVFLLAFFLLPNADVRWPTFAVFDAMLWQVIRVIGWPITVAILAMLTAAVTLLLQRAVTDNRRLLEAKRRAVLLRKRAAEWPVDSPRRVALLRAAAGVPARVLGASLVPAGLLLGPMVAGFIWLGARAEPAAWNVAAGSAVRVVVMTNGDWTKPVTLNVPTSVAIDSTTPAVQSLPPIRPTLQRLLNEVTASPAKATDLLPVNTTVDELRAYLHAPLPPQGLTWLLRPAENFDGMFYVQANTEGAATGAGITIGNSRPPQPSLVGGPKESPLRSIEVIYPRPALERHFVRITGVDVGWVGVYVGVYVLALVIVRRVARVA
ncbi:MAG: pyruvate phosphate dikinase PEP/pyruvate-binding protein [Phycisphaerales bacterium]|nr:pyruvate phosphate dikinase PEP/pyruvate-binding protein [Phycisphaerales bacterium]